MPDVTARLRRSRRLRHPSAARRIFGLDFSGATDAGRRAWLAEARLTPNHQRPQHLAHAVIALAVEPDVEGAPGGLRFHIGRALGLASAADAPTMGIEGERIRVEKAADKAGPARRLDMGAGQAEGEVAAKDAVRGRADEGAERRQRARPLDGAAGKCCDGPAAQDLETRARKLYGPPHEGARLAE